MESWVVLAMAAAAVRGAVALLVPVLPEEAYHWCYARHPALSYYDHPPMIAWMIALGRGLFGDTAIGIRLVPLSASLATTLAVGWVSRRLHGKEAARWTVLLLSLMPATLVGSAFGFPDAPLLLFWSLAIVYVLKALETGRGAWWLAAGGALGAALLSKYTACFLAVSVFLYLLASPRDRGWLKTPWPYLGVLISLAVFSPVLYWNATHDWASFRFQGVSRIEGMGMPRWTGALGFLAGQWGGILPLTLPLAVVAVQLAFRRGAAEDLFLLSLSLPTILFFFAIGLMRATHVFWPLPAYLGLTVLMGDAVARGGERVARFYRAGWKWVLGVSVAAMLGGILHVVRPLPWIPPLRGVYDWEVLAGKAQALRSTLPAGSFYLGIGKRYWCPAQLAFHLGNSGDVYAKNLLGEEGLQFSYWARPDALRGQDAVIVAEAGWSPDLEGLLRTWFKEVEPAGEWTVLGAPAQTRRNPERYLFYFAHGYSPQKSAARRTTP